MNPGKRTSQQLDDASLSKATPEPAKSERGPNTGTSAARMPRLSGTVGLYLRAIPASTAVKIRRLYRDAHKGSFPELNDSRRAVLAECIFTVENEVEQRHANQLKSRKPKVIAKLNDARNRLYDELGWNEATRGD